MMVRVWPLGLVFAILFMVLGPHNWFLASNRSSHTEVVPTAISSVLPDVSTVRDQPRHGLVDAIQTKQGWIVRVSSGWTLRYQLVVMGLLLVFAWPLRQMWRRRGAAEEEDHDI